MKIYQFDPSTIQESIGGMNFDGADAWTFTHGVLDLTSQGSATLTVSKKSTSFNNLGAFTEIGGDNEPVENIDPVLVPIAVKGDVAIWFDGDLTNAEKELAEYEYLETGRGYLVWGVLNVSKTDFYTPASELLGAVYINTDDTSSNF